jgi:hypothetical protein
MRETKISLPELGLVASTRVILGIGIGLLISRQINERERRAVGLALTLVGALSTIPIALEVLSSDRRIEKKPSGKVAKVA